MGYSCKESDTTEQLPFHFHVQDSLCSPRQKSVVTLLLKGEANIWASLVAQTAKHLPAMQETQVQSLGWEDPLEKEMATLSKDRKSTRLNPSHDRQSRMPSSAWIGRAHV